MEPTEQTRKIRIDQFNNFRKRVRLQNEDLCKLLMVKKSTLNAYVYGHRGLHAAMIRMGELIEFLQDFHPDAYANVMRNFFEVMSQPEEFHDKVSEEVDFDDLF